MGDDIRIGLERTSPALMEVYSTFGLERATQGPAALEWTFALPAAPCPPFCVARREERIIGLSANIAARLKLGRDEGIAFQAVDSYVSEEARGKRLFSRLAQGFADAAGAAGCDVAWGFPNANAAPAWFGGLGWQNFGQVPFLVRPLNASFFLKKARLPGAFRLARGAKAAHVSPDAFGPETDALLARFSAAIGCAVMRDAAALNHRAAFRSAGFLPLHERRRPVEINFGARALSPRGAPAEVRENWYLSYLDSDGI